MSCYQTLPLDLLAIVMQSNLVLSPLKDLFPRFYLWCMLPGTGDMMEGCPASNTLLYLVLSALIVPYLFILFSVARELYKTLTGMKKQSSRSKSMMTSEYADLQLELFGQEAMNNLQHDAKASKNVPVFMV